jgi:hypothetical protein
MPPCRKATGSLKIVHEKYGEKMKGNQDETEAYYNEFRTAKAVNEAMEGHIQKVRRQPSHDPTGTTCKRHYTAGSGWTDPLSCLCDVLSDGNNVDTRLLGCKRLFAPRYGVFATCGCLRQAASCCQTYGSTSAV